MRSTRICCTNATKILEVATKMYIKHDKEVKQEAKQRLKKKADLLPSALMERKMKVEKGQGCGHNRGRGQTRQEPKKQPRLERNQCM